MLKNDVEWHLPGRKRPIAYSSVATSDYILMLIDEVGGTINDLLAQKKFIWDVEAKEVLGKYEAAGYGGRLAGELFGEITFRRLAPHIYTDGRKIYEMRYG